MNDQKKHIEEQKLIAQYKAGKSMEALGKLYAPHMEMVLAVCYKYLKDRELARDCVMDIFEELQRKVAKHDIKTFTPWLYTLSRNHCLMKLRKTKREYSVEDFSRPKHVEFDAIVHLNGESEKEMALNLLEDCLKELKLEQQKSVALFYLESKSYVEIAEQTGFEIKKVKSYIQNGKRNLKICMDKNKNSDHEA